MLNGRDWNDGCTLAQWLEHRWAQAKVPGSNPGGDSFSSDFFRLCLSLKPVNILLLGAPRMLVCYVKCVGYSEGCVPHVSVCDW